MNRATSPTGWARNPDGSPGYTWNPCTGCLNHTPEGLCLQGLFPCYAYKLAHGRLKPLYLANMNFYTPASMNAEAIRAGRDPFIPRFWEERVREEFGSCYAGAIPKGIFVCDMGDLFGVGVPEAWTRRILSHIGMSWYREHRFYLLTKQPQNLIKFSPFPDNCWVGVTATDYWKYVDACNYLSQIKAKVKYISLEPLLSWDKKPSYFFNSSGINWLIIGACTGTRFEMTMLEQNYDIDLERYGKIFTAQPPIEWLREIVQAADQAGIKVFLKDNLKPLLEPIKISRFSDGFGLRQEMPE